jgi:hypothetical protein
MQQQFVYWPEYQFAGLNDVCSYYHMPFEARFKWAYDMTAIQLQK